MGRIEIDKKRKKGEREGGGGEDLKLIRKLAGTDNLVC